MTDNLQTPKLKIENLSKAFGAHQVLDGVSFALNSGESLAVLGRSGTGKSVLFKCIVGLLRPDAGTVFLDGQQITLANQSQAMAQVAVVFQASALFDSLPVWRNVMFAPMMNGPRQRQSALKDQAAAFLAQVGLGGDDLHKSTAALSGGMQKRVAIARALAQRPQVIFFDEPTTGLDPVTAGTIDRLIAQVSAQTGATTVTITHDLSTARLVAARAMFLEGGKVQWQGEIAHLTASNHDALPPVLAEFLTDRAAHTYG